MNLLLLIGIWIMALGFLWGGVTKLHTSEGDYEKENIQYDMVYMKKYDQTSLMIVLENKKDAYYIYPKLFPNELDMRQALKALEKSSTATVWYEGSGWIRGIKTDQFYIPSSRGLEVEREDGKWALWFSAFLFVAGIGFYLYMKWYFKENWMFGTIPEHRNDETRNLDLMDSSLTPTDSDEIIKLDLK